MVGLGSLIGSGVTSAANLIANGMSFRRQKELNRQKYEDMIEYARQNGATPAAIVQGITGSAGGSMPVVSSSNNPVTDLGSSLNNAVSANSSQEQSRAALINAETERQIGLMRLQFEPQKYFADIRKSLAEAFASTKSAFLHGSMKSYYDELVKDVQQVRPWKIAGLAQGLLNDMATFDKIVEETRTQKSQQSYYKSAAHELDTRSDLNEANKDLAYSQSLNESLRGFRQQWENTLLSYGINPDRPFFDNSARLMYTDPKLFKDRMDMFILSLNSIDSKLQANLGEHYKRNIASAYGLFKLNDYYQKQANSRAYRNSQAISVISKLIPFLGSSGSGPIVPF